MIGVDDLEVTLAAQNFSTLRPIPWKRVDRIRNTTSMWSQFVKSIGDESKEHEKDGKWIVEAEGIVEEAKFQQGRTNKSLISLRQFSALIDGLILDVQTDYANAFNITNFLRHFHQHGATSVGGAALDAMLMEAEAHADATAERGEYIGKRHNRAEEENRKTEELLKKVFANKLNDTVFEDLKNRIEVFGNWLEEYQATIYDEAKKNTLEAERMSEIVGKRIERYKEVSNSIEKLKAEAEDELAAGRNAIEKSKEEALLNVYDDVKAINESMVELPELAEQCHNITLLYSQLMDEYDEVYIGAATEHSEKLKEQAQAVVDNFANAKLEAENPLKASHAYENILEALQNATRAASQALAAAESARDVLGSTAEDSLLTNLAIVSDQSGAISDEAGLLSGKWAEEAFESQKSQLVDRLAFANEHKIQMTKRISVIKNEASSWDDKHDRMHSVLTNAARTAHDRSQAALKKAEALKEEVAEITEETEKLTNSTSSGIKEDIKKVKAARIALEYAKQRLGKVDTSTQSNSGRASEMARQISLLKDSIQQAREKTHQIKLSLNSGERGLCQRSFISPAHPSPANTYHVAFRPLQRVPDSLVVLTKTKSRRTQASEFFAIEVRGKRVIAHWNVGNGAKMVTNSHPINYIPAADLAHWYHIDAVRTGDSVNLTVALRESVDGGSRAKEPPVSVVVGSRGDSDVIFNTIPGETTLAIGADNGTASELGLSTGHFYGVIGGLKLDDTVLPLWAFDKTSAECEGAVAPPKASSRGHYYRDGFTNVTMAVAERTMTAITVTFSAYSPSGLLYFRGSQQSGDFVAVYLAAGKVVVKISLDGAKTASALTSQATYNDGLEHTVKAIRNNMELYLQVDSDADRFSTVIGGENTALNVEHDQHFVAGIPGAFRTDKFNAHDVQWKGFVGCILSVKPSQVGELDIEHAEHSQRRLPGCKFSGKKFEPADRVVGFSRPGYLITRGIQMNNNSSLAFSFRTKEENGTLMYQSSRVTSAKRARRDTGQGFFAFYLFKGYLVAHIGKDATSRKTTATFRTAQKVDDGQLHSVVFSRDAKKIHLRVDDKVIGGVESLDDVSPIGSDTSIMFLGGFKEGVHPPSEEIPQAVPLIGCVSDLFHDYIRLPLIPEEHVAQIGGCAIEDHVFSTPIDDPLNGEGANGHRKASKIHLDHVTGRNYYDVSPPKAGELSPSSDYQVSSPVFKPCSIQSPEADVHVDGDGATRFGISKSSHARINFREPFPNVTTLSVSFSLRTEQSNGMVWAWANYKNYTRYFFMNILDGYATLEVKGHKQPKILKFMARKLNDGQWHDVIIEKKERIMSVKVDELEAVEMVDCPAPKVMKRRMYVGGVISKHRSQFGLVTPAFDGCIRDFMVNGKPYPLNDPSTSRDLIPCARPSKSMYSHDGGFVVFDGIQKLSKKTTMRLDVEFEFRPVTDEGVLLALLSNGNPEATRMVLEVKQDKLHVTLIHEATGLEVRDVIPALGSLCDGSWHSLEVHLNGPTLLIVLDNEQNELPVDSLTSAARELILNLPINIGGVSSPVAERISTTTSLPGCYRHLKLGGVPKFFENAVKKNKILVDACPFN